MDRNINYPQAIPLAEDELNRGRHVQRAFSAVLSSVFGANTTLADGFAAIPTVPASLSFVVGRGSIIAPAATDSTNFGVLAADTTPQLKQADLLTPTTFPVTAPSTPGQSVAYLVQAAFTEFDDTAVALPYFNSAAPTAPFSGPNNSGTAQNTVRRQRAVLQLKNGAPANTGTQTVPAFDTGYIPLWVVTVAYGQTTVSSANIAPHPSALFVDPLQTGRGIQSGRLIGVQRFGTPGVFTYTPTLGTKSARVRVIGGGGGGAGAQGVSGANVSLGSGGTGGSYTNGWVPISGPVTVTIGSGGVSQSGGGGFPGGTSSFGTLLSAPGGPGGQLSPAGPLGSAIGGSNGSPGVGGDQSGDGVTGGTSLAITTTTGYGGAGGASILGGGGASVSQNITGVAANAPGSGGGGTCATTGNGALTGGRGANGLIVIEEYC